MTYMSSQTAVWNTLMAPGMVVLIKKMVKRKICFFPDAIQYPYIQLVNYIAPNGDISR